MINKKLKDILLYKKFEELIEKICLSEDALKEFENTRKEVWKEVNKIYKKEGLISND
ncbi:hypothetical protein [Archaeoglobus sp.]